MSEKTYTKPVIGPEITDLGKVSTDLKQDAKIKHAPKDIDGNIIRKEDGHYALPSIKSAKENGSYRGPVVLNDKDYLFQAVGKDNNFLILHEKKNLNLKGEVLPQLEAGKRMNGFNVQIHYSGKSANMYPYSPEKEAEKRQQARSDVARSDKASPSLTQSNFDKQVNEIAQTIKNVKSRDAFLKHMETMRAQAFPQQQRETRPASPAKEAQTTEQSR